MAFEPGDVVVLKSGGLAMTVAVEEDSVECLWLGEEGELFRESIPSVALIAASDASDAAEEDAEEEEEEEEESNDEETDQEDEEPGDEEAATAKRKRKTA
jgi:uncharacterized protein YodC (DUF2158 family)